MVTVRFESPTLRKIFGMSSIMFSFGNQATSLPRFWARNLIHVLKMFEQMVFKIPKRSARSSLRNPKRSRIRVSKPSFLKYKAKVGYKELRIT